MPHQWCHGMIAAWHDLQLGMRAQGPSRKCVFACVCVCVCVCVCNDCFKHPVSNNSCALAKNCHISTSAGGTLKSISPETLFFFIVLSPKIRIYWTMQLLEMYFTKKSSIAEWVSFFCTYLNQNGNEEWWPSIAHLNQLKRAQFVVL